MAERIQIGKGVEGPGQASCTVRLVFTLKGQATAEELEIFNPTSPVRVQDVFLSTGQNSVQMPGPPQQAYAALIMPPEGMTTELIYLLGDGGQTSGIPMHPRAPILLTFYDESGYPPTYNTLYFKSITAQFYGEVDLVSNSPNPGTVDFRVTHGLEDGRKVQFLHGTLPPEVRLNTWYKVKVVDQTTVNLYSDSPDNCLIFSSDGEAFIATPNKMRIYWF